MMWPIDPNWQMTLLFLIALASLGFVMKLVVLLLPTKVQIFLARCGALICVKQLIAHAIATC